MPCLLGCLAAFFPRVAVALVWLFGHGYLGRAYEHWVWPLLGFLFLPLTTLVFAYAVNSLGEPAEVTPLGWVLVFVALAGDLGLIGGGTKTAARARFGRWRRGLGE